MIVPVLSVTIISFGQSRQRCVICGCRNVQYVHFADLMLVADAFGVKQGFNFEGKIVGLVYNSLLFQGHQRLQSSIKHPLFTI